MEVIAGLVIGLILGFVIGNYAGREQFRKEVSENFIKSVEAIGKATKQQEQKTIVSTMN